VVTAALANADTQRGDLGNPAPPVYIDTGRVSSREGFDTIPSQGRHDGCLNGTHQIAYPQPLAADIEHRVTNNLAGAVIGNLAAAIHLNHGNIAGHQQVLLLARLTLGKHRVVLYQPQLIGGITVALGSESLHGIKHRQIRLATQPSHPQCGQRGRYHSEHHLHVFTHLQIGKNGFKLADSRSGDSDSNGLETAIAAFAHQHLGLVKTGGVAVHDAVYMVAKFHAGVSHHLDGILAGELDFRRFGLAHCRL